MRLVGIWTIVLLVCLGIIFIAGANDSRECIKYAPPTPTPIPPERIYSEWIPMPGTGFQSGNGWVRAKELNNFAYERSHNVLTDAEYAAIEKEHGLRMCIGSR